MFLFYIWNKNIHWFIGPLNGFIDLSIILYYENNKLWIIIMTETTETSWNNDFCSLSVLFLEK